MLTSNIDVVFDICCLSFSSLTLGSCAAISKNNVFDKFDIFGTKLQTWKSQLTTENFAMHQGKTECVIQHAEILNLPMISRKESKTKQSSLGKQSNGHILKIL